MKNLFVLKIIREIFFGKRRYELLIEKDSNQFLGKDNRFNTAYTNMEFKKVSEKENYFEVHKSHHFTANIMRTFFSGTISSDQCGASIVGKFKYKIISKLLILSLILSVYLSFINEFGYGTSILFSYLIILLMQFPLYLFGWTNSYSEQEIIEYLIARGQLKEHGT